MPPLCGKSKPFQSALPYDVFYVLMAIFFSWALKGRDVLTPTRQPRGGTAAQVRGVREGKRAENKANGHTIHPWREQARKTKAFWRLSLSSMDKDDSPSRRVRDGEGRKEGGDLLTGRAEGRKRNLCCGYVRRKEG